MLLLSAEILWKLLIRSSLHCSCYGIPKGIQPLPQSQSSQWGTKGPWHPRDELYSYQLNALSNHSPSILIILYHQRLTFANQMIPEPPVRNQRIALVGLLVYYYV